VQIAGVPQLLIPATMAVLEADRVVDPQFLVLLISGSGNRL
jgi:hypothetical protein